MKIGDLLKHLVSEDSADVARAEAEIDLIMKNTPVINAGYDLPQKKGVVRYDSDVHTEDDVAKMPPYLRRQIALARSRNPRGRLVLTQTAAFPEDSSADRRELISAQNGLRLV